MSIREKLILVLLLFAAVPMVPMGYLGFVNARKSLEEARIAGLASTADLKVEKIEAFFQMRRGDISSVQHFDAVQENLPSWPVWPVTLRGVRTGGPNKSWTNISRRFDESAGTPTSCW